MALCWQY